MLGVEPEVLDQLGIGLRRMLGRGRLLLEEPDRVEQTLQRMLRLLAVDRNRGRDHDRELARLPLDEQIRRALAIRTPLVDGSGDLAQPREGQF